MARIGKLIADPEIDIRVYKPTNKTKFERNEEFIKHLNVFDVQDKAMILLEFLSTSKIVGFRKNGMLMHYRFLKFYLK